MAQSWPFRVIARVENDCDSKFAVPRQSGLVPELLSRIVFEPEFRVRDALRGLEDWSHLWLIWIFDRNARDSWSPTVRPPRLGGNARLGVFATRSPFRPNPVGLSCVRLLKVEENGADAPSLIVSGADLASGTPLIDIKPYLSYADSIPDARSGFTEHLEDRRLEVSVPPEVLSAVPAHAREGLLGLLSRDPRPAYQRDPERVYGFTYAGINIHFTVSDGVLTVVSADAGPASSHTQRITPE